MHKEEYLRENNCSNKIRKWKKILSGYNEHWKEFHIENSALLIIDMQNYFLDKRSHAYVPSKNLLLKNTKQLLAAYREKNLPILFTYFAVKEPEEDPIKRWWGESVFDKSIESRIVKILEPLPHEKVIRKNNYNAFYNTDAEQFLKQKGIKNVLISGVLTNLCCETTAREAFIRNFDVFFLLDATATYNEEMHLSSLCSLSYGFATPVASEEIMKQLKQFQRERIT